jgi:hypothetical protein
LEAEAMRKRRMNRGFEEKRKEFDRIPKTCQRLPFLYRMDNRKRRPLKNQKDQPPK